MSNTLNDLEKIEWITAIESFLASQASIAASTERIADYLKTIDHSLSEIQKLIYLKM